MQAAPLSSLPVTLLAMLATLLLVLAMLAMLLLAMRPMLPMLPLLLLLLLEAGVLSRASQSATKLRRSSAAACTGLKERLWEQTTTATRTTSVRRGAVGGRQSVVRAESREK